MERKRMKKQNKTEIKMIMLVPLIIKIYKSIKCHKIVCLSGICNGSNQMLYFKESGSDLKRLMGHCSGSLGKMLTCSSLLI